MKQVFLYAGQGSQVCGMGKDFYEKCEDYRQAFDALPNAGKWKFCMEKGSMEELTKTENTQPCMAAFAASVTSALQKKGIVPDAACGLSLGEYGALYAAKVLTASQYVDLTAFRGKVMADAAKGHNCCMSAVLGTNAENVEKACEMNQDKGMVTVANYNCPGQYVICGEEKAVEAAEESAKELGAKRVIRLQVGGPFHTKYMYEAAEKLHEKMLQMTFSSPEIPVVLNVSGQYLKAEDNLKHILEQQVQSSVYFEDSLVRLLEDGAETFIEIGPGNALSGFVRKTAKSLGKKINVYSISTVEDFEAVCEKFQ